MQRELRSKTLRYLLATFGVFTSAFFWLVVATFPSFFLFNPLANSSPARAVLLTAMMIAWICLSSGPVIIFGLLASGIDRGLRFLPIVALAWPVLLIVNHVSLAVVEHRWYTGYLLQYPIFIATDALLPLLLVAVWLELHPADHPLRHAVKRHKALQAD
jgi:hypothetical protein